MKKVKIFVGSSSEAEEQRLKVLEILEKNERVIPVSWEKVFEAGDFSLESLLNAINDVDSAILIATLDDKTWYRGSEGYTPRDNVLFELGLFMGCLGRKKVGLIVCKDAEGNSPKIPTDLDGYNYIGFSEEKEATNVRQLERWLLRLLGQFNLENEKVNTPFDRLVEEYPYLPESWKDEIQNYVFNPYRKLSRDAIRGEFTLNIPQYYNSVFNAVRNTTSESKIRAVSVLGEEFWTNDPFQKRYINLNIKASNNGAEIKRLFVLNRGIHSGLWKIIQNQLDNNIEIRIIDSKTYSKFTHLDDMVVIEDEKEMRSYISTQILDDSNRLKSAILNVNTDSCKDKIKDFDTIWNLSELPKPSMVDISRQSTDSPPGLVLEVYNLEEDVISCESAAEARGVPLCNELKTMILSTTDGFVAVHIPGDGEISLRAVKNTLEVKKAFIAPKDELYKLELSPGTVSAILNPVWEMPHLISKRVLAQDFVTTNNGTRKQYFKFDPVILLEANKKLVGQFEK